MNRNRLLDNTRLLEQAQGLEQAQNTKQRRITRQKQTTRQAQTTKHAWIVMKLADLDVLVTFIKVWGSESTSSLPKNLLSGSGFEQQKARLERAY